MKKWLTYTVPARSVREGDVILPCFRVDRITHAALDGIGKFICNNDTATISRAWDEPVQIERLS